MDQIFFQNRVVQCQRKHLFNPVQPHLECPDETALFYLLAGDVRVLFRKHKEVQPVQHNHRGSAVLAKAPLRFELDVSELELLNLKNRVYMHNNTD